LNFCPCRGAGMYLVEENGYSVMRICSCPAGLRRKEYLRDEAQGTRRGSKERAREKRPTVRLPF